MVVKIGLKVTRSMIKKWVLQCMARWEEAWMGRKLFSAEELVMVAMSPAGTSSFTPVQIQKLVFLVEDRLGKALGGSSFRFQAYDYGPFDKAVYRALESLSERGHVDISWDLAGLRRYSLTDSGEKAAKVLTKKITDKDAARGIRRLCDWVQDQSFSSLVAAIYKAYPKMRENSVFCD